MSSKPTKTPWWMFPLAMILAVGVFKSACSPESGNDNVQTVAGKKTSMTDAQAANVALVTLNLNPWVEVGKKVEEFKGCGPDKYGQMFLEYETTSREGIATIESGIELGENQWETAMDELADSSDEARTYHRLRQMTKENIELLAEFSALYADYRDWYYRCKSFAEHTASGEAFLESLVRGSQGDPFGKATEYLREQRQFRTEYERLDDREEVVLRKKSELVDEFAAVMRKYIPSSEPRRGQEFGR